MTTLISLSSVDWCMYGMEWHALSSPLSLNEHYAFPQLLLFIRVARVPGNSSGFHWGTQQEVLTVEVIIAEEVAATCRTRRCLSVCLSDDLSYQLTVMSSQSANKHACKDSRREAMVVVWVVSFEWKAVKVKIEQRCVFGCSYRWGWKWYVRVQCWWSFRYIMATSVTTIVLLQRRHTSSYITFPSCLSSTDFLFKHPNMCQSLYSFCHATIIWKSHCPML